MNDNQRLIASFFLGCFTYLCAINFQKTSPFGIAGSIGLRWICGVGAAVSFIISVIVVAPMFTNKKK